MLNLRFGVTLFIVATLGFLAPGGADPVTVVSLPDTTGVVGDRIRVNLDMVDADSMHAATIDIAFDPAVLAPRPGSLALGPLGASPQHAPLFGASVLADSIFRIAYSAADSIVGSGTFVSFELDLVGEGASPLRFERILLERMPDIQLPATGDPGSVVAGPAAVEEATWGRVKQRFGVAPRGTGHF